MSSDFTLRVFESNYIILSKYTLSRVITLGTRTGRSIIRIKSFMGGWGNRTPPKSFVSFLA